MLWKSPLLRITFNFIFYLNENTDDVFLAEVDSIKSKSDILTDFSIQLIFPPAY